MLDDMLQRVCHFGTPLGRREGGKHFKIAAMTGPFAIMLSPVRQRLTFLRIGVGPPLRGGEIDARQQQPIWMDVQDTTRKFIES